MAVPALSILAYVALTRGGAGDAPSEPGRSAWISAEEGGGPPSDGSGAGGPDGTLLRVAVAPIVSPEASLTQYRGLVEYLGRAVGRTGRMIQRSSYSEINSLLRKGLADVAFVCTYSYVLGARDFGLEAIAAPVVRGHARYRSLFIVPAGSRATTIFDLEGKRLAAADVLSNTGWLYPSFVLRGRGFDIRDFFSEIVFTQGHDRAIRAVASGFVDGAAVDSLVYEQMSSEDPAMMKGIKVIMGSPEFGMPPVVVSPEIEPGLKKRVQEALLTLHETAEGKAVLEPLGFDRFTPVGDRDYDGIREMLDAAAGGR